MKINLLLLTLVTLIIASCGTGTYEEKAEEPSEFQIEAQAFLDEYASKAKGLFYTASQAEWASNIKIIEDDSTNSPFS